MYSPKHRVPIFSLVSIIIFFIFHLPLDAQGIYQNFGVTNLGGADNIGVIFSTDSNGANIKVRHAFNYINPGSNPLSSSMIPFNGKLYGVATGDYIGYRGTIFEFDPLNGNYTRKISFGGIDGEEPYGGLVLFNNQFYGTTGIGGSNNTGVLFKYDPLTNSYTKLWDMEQSTGIYPQGELIEFNNKLYGLAAGGQQGYGVIFEYDPLTNIYTKKIDFDGMNGAGPAGGLILFNNKLFGMTEQGGLGLSTNGGDGVLFEYDPATNVLSKKIDLTMAGGNKPSGSLVLYNDSLWGMTPSGGANNAGVLFAYNPTSNDYTKKIDLDSAGGSNPTGGLIVFQNRLLGLTTNGGSYNVGVLFEYDPALNTYSKKIDLEAARGTYPFGSLTAFNNLVFGFTYKGGTADAGVIFEYNPSTATYTKKIDFSTSAGYNVNGSFVYLNKSLYGLASSGGTSNAGALFKFDLSNNTSTTEVNFDSISGTHPISQLAVAGNKLYGVTADGGKYNKGVLFSYDPTAKIYTRLFEFDSLNGSKPAAGSNLVVYNNKLYGSTPAGGAGNLGVLFSYDLTTAVYGKIFDFRFPLAYVPYGAPVAVNGKLYGITLGGGTVFSGGTMYELDPVSNSYTSKVIFDNQNTYGGALNMVPYNNKLYGSTFTMSPGGTVSGLIFEYDPATNQYTKKSAYQGIDGGGAGNYLTVRNNLFFGMTAEGGAAGKGTVFNYNPLTNIYTKTADFDSLSGSMPFNNSLIAVPASVAEGSIGNCSALTPFSVDNTNNNNWIGITDQYGDAVAEINPNGNDLGNITASLYVQHPPARNAGGLNYLDRSLTITVQNQPAAGHPVDVRLYITKTELNDLINTPNSGIGSVNDLIVYKSESTCSNTIANDVVPLATAAADWGANYVLTTSVASFSTFHFSAANVNLPVYLLGFTAVRKNKNQDQLDWQTSTELNSDYFGIERSQDQNHFMSVGRVAAARISSVKTNYQFIDNYYQAGDIYYRLKMVDKDGKFSYSKILKLDGSATVMGISPNPVQDMITIAGVALLSQLQIIDAAGKTVSKAATVNASPFRYDVSDLKPGVYLLRLSNNKEVKVLRFVKQ